MVNVVIDSFVGALLHFMCDLLSDMLSLDKNRHFLFALLCVM